MTVSRWQQHGHVAGSIAHHDGHVFPHPISLWDLYGVSRKPRRQVDNDSTGRHRSVKWPEAGRKDPVNTFATVATRSRATNRRDCVPPHTVHCGWWCTALLSVAVGKGVCASCQRVCLFRPLYPSGPPSCLCLDVSSPLCGARYVGPHVGSLLSNC